MIPENRLSTVPVAAQLFTPDDIATGLIIDYEKAGVAIRQPIEGLNKYNWEFAIEDNTKVYCKRQDQDTKHYLYTGEDITEIYGTFDRNMFPCIVFKEGSDYKFQWFDTSINNNKTTLLAGVRSPRLCHDDKRDEALIDSDVILTYIKDEKVYYLLQRDRYTVEYFAFEEEVKGRSIIHFGMNKALRLQWTLHQTTKIKPKK